jgi:predicted helicase
LIPNVERGKTAVFEPDRINIAIYRPFNKQFIYLGDKFIHRRGQFDEIFHSNEKNTIISISSTNKGLGILVSDCIADIHFNGDTQCFPLKYYDIRQKQSRSLFDVEGDSEYIRRDGVSDFILERAKAIYGKNVGKEEIFYYVYGFLHSPEYLIKFANDLKKMLPRLPLVEDVRDFWKFSKAGRELAELHINYEKVPAYEGVKVTGFDSGFYRVEKMRFPSKNQKDTIIYNSKIVIENIPAKAYEYVVNGKSAIEWIMERYQVTVHKESGIKNDPNDWADEVGNPRYILDLLLSIINVSVKTVGIVEGLPGVRFE